jgi:hypothetical protein
MSRTNPALAFLTGLLLSPITQAVLALLILGAPAYSLAIPPQKAECTGPDFDDVYKRLACKQAAIAGQMKYTSDHAFGEGTKLNQSLSPTHIKQIKNATEKAKRAEKKNDKEFFKRQARTEARGNKQDGHLIPFDDVNDDVNQDGICDYEQEGVGLEKNAQCAAIELINDQLQICNPEKKNKGNGKGNNPKFAGLECDRSTDVEDSEDMIEAAEQLEATYNVAEDNLIEMNEHLDNVNEAGPGPAISVAGGCIVPSPTPGLNEAAEGLRYLKASTFGAARVIIDLTAQTAFGFNARSAGVVADGIAAVADIAFIAVDFRRQEDSRALQNAIMDCVVESADQIAALRADVAALKVLMQQEHDDIMANDDENTAMIIQLLNTPQGQREQFPIK